MIHSLPLAPQRDSDPLSHEADWRWQLQHAIRGVDQLQRVIPLTPQEQAAMRAAERSGLPIAITPYYASLFGTDPSCPIRRQVIPDAAEGQAAPGDLVDPLGEDAHELAPGLFQRYPDRALLFTTDHCAVYCRFCTRSRLVGAGSGARSLSQLEPALQYLRAHPQVRDVILSGGDVLTLGTERLVRLVARVRDIPSVETIRLATRVPVVLPQRIQVELLEALRPLHPLWIMTHFNHPTELTELSIAACNRLADHGFPVMNQTVLLRGVNDNSELLALLFRGLVRQRVRPYYLLQADPVRGTGHLRTPLELGLRIMAELQGTLSGIALPKFIVDTPGGHGKVPLMPDYVVRRGAGVTRLRSPRGVEVDYWDPAVSGPAGNDQPPTC